MALSGVHVACGYVGGAGRNLQVQALMKKPVWSETLAAAGTTTNVAPTSVDQSVGDPCFEIRSSLDVFVAISSGPNATTGARLFVPANETRNVFCAPGDKLAWIAA